MATMQNQYSPLSSVPGMAGQRTEGVDWSREITPPQQQTAGTPSAASGAPRGDRALMAAAAGAQLDLKNHLPADVIDVPTTAGEAEAGSWKTMLSRNLGNYVVATFLIGTQGTVAWEGILYDVGSNYLTIYQPGRDRYIVSDIYSLKYIEFYDTTRRRMCDELLREQRQQPNG